MNSGYVGLDSAFFKVEPKPTQTSTLTDWFGPGWASVFFPPPALFSLQFNDWKSEGAKFLVHTCGLCEYKDTKDWRRQDQDGHRVETHSQMTQIGDDWRFSKTEWKWFMKTWTKGSVSILIVMMEKENRRRRRETEEMMEDDEEKDWLRLRWGLI